MQINKNNFTTTKTTPSVVPPRITTTTTNFQHYPIVQQSLQIKSEPIIEYEILSDTTFDTNTEETDDCNYNNGDNNYCLPLSNNFNSSNTRALSSFSNSVYVPIQSMVRLSDNNFLRTTTTTSDTEFMKNYLQSSSSLSLPTTVADLNSTMIDSPMQISSSTSYDAPTIVTANAKSTITKLIEKNNGEKNSANVELLAKKVVKPKLKTLKSVPRALSGLSGWSSCNKNDLELLTDSSFYKLRNKNEKLIKNVVKRQFRKTLDDKVINPLNKLKHEVKEEEKKFVLRKTSNRLHNASNVSCTSKSINNGKRKLLGYRQQTIKNGKIIEKNDKKPNSFIVKNTRNFNKMLSNLPMRKNKKINKTIEDEQKQNFLEKLRERDVKNTAKQL